MWRRQGRVCRDPSLAEALSLSQACADGAPLSPQPILAQLPVWGCDGRKDFIWRVGTVWFEIL